MAASVCFLLSFAAWWTLREASFRLAEQVETTHYANPATRHPPPRMKLAIHEIAFGGKGVGRLEDGRVHVFVPFVAVGEMAEVEIVKTHRHYLEARLVAVENTAAVRRAIRVGRTLHQR